MDIKAALADRTLKSPPAGVVAWLFYGPDTGMISERAGQLAKHLANANPKEPGEIIRMDDDDLAGGTEKLAVELRTMPMFGGRKIVRIRAEKRLKPDLIAGLIDPHGGALAGILIVEAGDLKADSKLRDLFVKADNAAAVGCYPDDEKALATVVNEVLNLRRITITPQARDHLIALLGADRAFSRNEIEKLSLYAGDGGEIQIEDIDAVVGDASSLQVDEIATSAFAGRTADALRDLDRAAAEGTSAQTVLLAIQRHALKLHQARVSVEAGSSIDAAIKGLRPPVFYKAQTAFAAQLNRWTLAGLGRMLVEIQATIARQRRVTVLAQLEDELLGDLLIRISVSGKLAGLPTLMQARIGEGGGSKTI